MSELALEALLERRLGHRLTAEEEALVRAALPRDSAGWAGDKVARAVAILSKTGDPKYRDDLLGALHVTDDPHVAAFAIKGLVRFLDETADHIPKLIDLCRRTSFDEHGHAQHVAVQLAADVLAEHDSPLLMQALIVLAENPEEPVTLRQDAVASASVGLERLLDEGEEMPETGAEILALARMLIDARLN